MIDNLEVVELSAKCKTQSGKRRVCDAIIMPPSDEGGGTSIASDGGRDRCINNLISPSVSLRSTAPSSEGAEKEKAKDPDKFKFEETICRR